MLQVSVPHASLEPRETTLFTQKIYEIVYEKVYVLQIYVFVESLKK